MMQPKFIQGASSTFYMLKEELPTSLLRKIAEMTNKRITCLKNKGQLLKSTQLKQSAYSISFLRKKRAEFKNRSNGHPLDNQIVLQEITKIKFPFLSSIFFSLYPMCYLLLFLKTRNSNHQEGQYYLTHFLVVLFFS